MRGVRRASCASAVVLRHQGSRTAKLSVGGKAPATNVADLQSDGNTKPNRNMCSASQILTLPPPAGKQPFGKTTLLPLKPTWPASMLQPPRCWLNSAKKLQKGCCQLIWFAQADVLSAKDVKGVRRPCKSASLPPLKMK